MFQILSVLMFLVMSLAFPPLFVVTGPAVIVWLLRTSERRREVVRQRQVYEAHKDFERRSKAVRRAF